MTDLLERVGREQLIFGHRGVPRDAPENTVPSFERAVALGLDGVELDVQLCRTGEPVVFHDFTLDKLTDGSGPVRELSFDELRRLDAGAHCGEKFRDERIPALEEVLQVLGGAMLVNLELKQRSIREEGLEAKVVDLVRKMGLRSSVILSSFNPFCVMRASRLDPGLKVGLLFADDQRFYLRRAWASHLIRIDGLHPRYPLVDETLMRRARAKKWFVATWTVDEPAMAKRLFEAGVDIIITNLPEQMRRALKPEER